MSAYILYLYIFILFENKLLHKLLQTQTRMIGA